ncbi:alpha/beta hydrolase [uncultured Paenalcaligenes sp.]|uniref:alpha/beta fold hydrolase n=1 Tax=uncultured Paenalcaligenes sp. TaxID=1588925 RepID=UPI00262C6DAD|nr:alpha/beta hydrolase [uncultured Paenalcaligenes sp.]
MKKKSEVIHLQWNGKQRDIEYQWVGVNNTTAPLMIFLHEGLGSIAHWQNWPERLCQALGYRGLIYSRYAYGQSTPRPATEKWHGDYLHIEAQQALPALLKALNVTEPFTLFGHSDGATIALLYAAMPKHLAKNIIVLAPHLYIEPMTTAGVQQAIEWYKQGDLRQRLSRYHADVDSAFWGWAGVWGDEYYLHHWNIEQDIKHIKCPVLAIQGTDDEYASLAQIYDLKKHIPHTETCALEVCRHSPYIDMPDRVIDLVTQFLAKQPM